MKTYYECETCGKRFATPDEAKKCEAFHVEEAAKKEKLRVEKKSREEKINELIKSYVEDYGTFPNVSVSGTYVNPLGIFSHFGF